MRLLTVLSRVNPSKKLFLNGLPARRAVPLSVNSVSCMFRGESILNGIGLTDEVENTARRVSFRP